MTSESGDLKFRSFSGPVGLGGWLILPGLSLFLSVFQHLGATVQVIGFLRPEKWNSLTWPGSASYDPLWAPLVIFELAAFAALTMFDILLLYLFWGRRRALPQMMIAWLIFRAIFSVAVVLITRHIPGAVSEDSNLQGFVAPIVTCLVWIPYFCTSERVKATFVL